MQSQEAGERDLGGKGDSVEKIEHDMALGRGTGLNPGGPAKRMERGNLGR